MPLRRPHPAEEFPPVGHDLAATRPSRTDRCEHGAAPEPPQPELTVSELRDGRYAVVAATTGPFTAERPFIVSIAPARLTDGLHH
jgi:hypothetical protein